jgi:hypothetical protein
MGKVGRGETGRTGHAVSDPRRPAAGENEHVRSMRQHSGENDGYGCLRQKADWRAWRIF